MLREFKTFVMRGNVVDLAVGVVIGAAFNSVVQSIVNGLLNPIVALFGASSLNELSFSIGTKVVDGETVNNIFAYGSVLNAALQLVIIAAVLFFFVVKPVNALESRRKSGEETPEPATRSCPECLSEIPKAARRCSQCASEIGAAA
ncbi:MAG TPA: large conductance mechanosensitive channel protein MscL [Actinomycetota bacterium]